jgi:hypothetical protein
LWKKYSVPSSAATKPKPLSLTMRLIVPETAAAMLYILPIEVDERAPQGAERRNQGIANGADYLVNV